ncbi:MAG: MBL fold metallo-hydrolase, partial [Treponema sp.]|nr:MBL fold metallo-hydrolase [Treponema sp.]
MQEKLFTHITVGEIATNCWIYPLDHRECVLIDPGAEPDRILARLKTLKLKPAYILLTHGHFDHIAALPRLAAAFSPAIAIHRDDAEYLGPGSYQVHCRSFTVAAGNAAYVDALWEDMPSPTVVLSEGDTIGPFRVLHLPGHTPGSAAFYDETAKVLFSGDTLFRGDYGRTDLPGGDAAKIMESLKRLFAMDKDIRVYPGHGPA